MDDFIFRQGYRCYLTSTDELFRLLWNVDHPGDDVISADYTVYDVIYPVDDVISLQPHVIPHIITNSLNKQLFPSGRICAAYHPFSVMKENLQMIPPKWKVHFSFDSLQPGKCQAVSLLSHYACYDGGNARCINVEIYSANLYSHMVIKHIIKAVEYSLQMDHYKGKIVFELGLPLYADESVDNFASKMGLIRIHQVEKYLIVRKVIN